MCVCEREREREREGVGVCDRGGGMGKKFGGIRMGKVLFPHDIAFRILFFMLFHLCRER